MCGIAGFVGEGLENHRSVSKLVSLVAHRGPDHSGMTTSPDGQCTLGHARLSIIDLSPEANQPMVDPLTGNIIVFNGEIYNFQKHRRECQEKGDSFYSHSDTEVILALYRRYGIDCLRYLRGMFAFALWDVTQQRLLLARDRLGKKPLNYALLPEGLVFCSEIHPLTRYPSISRDMDIEALELYLQLQYIPYPWTIYRQIRKLPPAHYAVLDRKTFKIECYWHIDYTRKVRISEQEALDGLEEKLTEAVRLRMIADVPIGALLSGGVDSSIIVALMAKLSSKPIRTFSIGFREGAYDELPYAQQAADICHTMHYPEIVRGEVEHLLPTLTRHYGEPYADCSAVPSFFVCEAARRHVKVAINGDGGDELLGGYPRYWLSPTSLRSSIALGKLISPETLIPFVPLFAAGKNILVRAIRKVLVEHVHPELRSFFYSGFWNDPERTALLGRLEDSKLLRTWRTKWMRRAIASADNGVDRMLWLDNNTYLPDDLLVKMDIASMHCGLETRSPLLDHEVIEYCASLPTKLKVNDHTGKYLLKKLAERYFPKELVYRQKMGFGIPLNAWLRGPLRSTLNDITQDRCIMEPLRPKIINGLLQEFFEQGVDHSSRLWAILIFGIWRKYDQRLQ